jgi:hypothetical protein
VKDMSGFSEATAGANGGRSEDDFSFDVGVVPLSTVGEVVWWLAIYWALIINLKMHDLKLGLKPLVVIHNTFLSVASLHLLVSMCCELYDMFLVGGAYSVYCDPEGRWTRGRIYYLLYINYLFKFYELGDTVLLALRGKEISFLHVYHHSATVVLCYTQLRAETSLQWLIVSLNLMVHVVMYAYYALQALGYDVWWKKYLTTLQILQFVIGIFNGFFILYSKFTQTPSCHGSLTATMFGFFIVTSYLILFIQFYQKNYKKKSF